MSTTAKPKTIFASIDSKVLHAFTPILRSAAESPQRFYDGAFFVYPHDDGALCIATDGVVLAAYLDRNGRASAPAQFLIPERLLAACAPPAAFIGVYQGWSEPLPLPEWMQPKDVFLFEAGAIVFPAMWHPADSEDPENGHVLLSLGAKDDEVYRGEDFRAKAPRFDPRPILAKLPDEEAPGPVYLNPYAISLFVGCFDILGLKGAVRFARHGAEAPTSLLFHACPDFIGLIMPMTGGAAPARPAFMAALRPSDDAAPEPEPARDAA